MWVLFLFASSSISGEFGVTSHEFQSRYSCITAVSALKTRHYVKDAYCVKK